MDIKENSAADTELSADLERLEARINEIDEEVETCPLDWSHCRSNVKGVTLYVAIFSRF